MEQIAKRKKGRPDKVEPLKEVITLIWSKHPQWKDDEIRNELRIRLISQVKKEHENWNDSLVNEEVDVKLPGVYSIGDFRRKTLTPNKEKMDASELDKPWHLGLIKKYPQVAPEAMLPINAVQSWAEKNSHEPVTVRQALWLNWLYPWLPLYIGREKPKKAGVEFDWLWHWSRAYAIEERLSNLMGLDFVDTTELDKWLRELGAVEVFGDWGYLIFVKHGKTVALVGGGPKTSLMTPENIEWQKEHPEIVRKMRETLIKDGEQK